MVHLKTNNKLFCSRFLRLGFKIYLGAITRRILPGPLGIKNNKIFCITSDGKFVIYGGCWDRSLRAYSLSKNKLVSSVVRHLEPISCLALDVSGSKHLITGSKDTTSILWEILYTIGSVEKFALKPIQVRLTF